MEENEFFDFGEDPQDVVNPTDTDSEGSIFGNFSDDDSEGNQDGNGDGDEGNEPSENDYINQFLQSRGIDRNAIEITEEDGTITTVSFDDLSDEDKLALLSEDAPEEPTDAGITDNDIAIINYFRTNRINSLQEFADGIAKQAVADYVASQQNAPKSDIDGYSDDEVIAYDFIQKYGDEMSDEEIDAEIDRLKQDEEAYNKRVSLLRKYYKNEEEAQRKLYEDEQAAQHEADTKAFQQAYGQAAYNLNTIQGIDLEDTDKQELLDYVLTKDQFGKTEFSKALDDPEQVLKMAWFLKNGESAAEATRNYFAQLLSKQRAQAAKSAQKQPRAVSRTSSSTNTATRPNKTNNSFKF